MEGMREHHHWTSVVIAAVLSLIVGAIAGYYIGASQAEPQATSASSVVEEVSRGVERPANPFEQGGYQNPLRGVKVNPFE